MVAKKTEPKKVESKVNKEIQTSIQPELNIGLVGHVDHGKTTILEK